MDANLPILDHRKALGFDAIEITPFAPDMRKIAKLCCIWQKFADSPDTLATEGLKYLKEIYCEVFHN